MGLRLTTQFPFAPASEESERAKAEVDAAIEAGSLGFAKLPYQGEEELQAIEQLAATIKSQFKAVIIIGIGGSDLGTRAVHRALNHQFYNLRQQPQLFFAGDTTDPIALQEIFESVHWPDTAVVMVSKSGNTVEQLSAFFLARDAIKQAVGDAYVNHIIAVTDPVTGSLRELANKEGYATLPIPSEVGGRFSVFSAVGLFPLALTGVDIRALLTGGRAALEEYRPQALEFAAHQHVAYWMGRKIQVLMPYVYSMREIGFWFRQLWAESLGKSQSNHDETINVGPTPVAALGPTDQHSQVQLYRDGPDDKTFTFITVKEWSRDLHIPQELPDIPALSYLKGLSLAHILQAEYEGTEAALREVGRPTMTIELDRLDAWHIGALLVFFELATAYAGSLFNINPYDQPGVERGKEITRSRLQSPVV